MAVIVVSISGINGEREKGRPEEGKNVKSNFCN